MVKGIKILVLDILKPHEPNLVEFSNELLKLAGVKNTELAVYAVDEKTESVKAVIEGPNLDFEIIRKAIENTGAAVHSIDKLSAGEKLASDKLPELPHIPRAL